MPYIANPDDLARDYAEGKPFAYLRAAYSLTDGQIHDFGFEQGLVYGSLRKDDAPRLLEGAVVDMPQSYDPKPSAGELAIPEDPDTVRRREVRDAGRSMSDDMLELHQLMRGALKRDIQGALDPAGLENHHPARRDVQAVRALRGKNESAFDALDKLAKTGKSLIELERANEAPAGVTNGGTTVHIDNRSVNVGGQDVPGGNNTALDPKSKLVGLMGMIEVLKERKRKAEVASREQEDF